MNYRQLGNSDLHVSEIALGSWLTYGGGVARDQAAACIERAFGLGINFIDTANVYGHGAAETILGELLAGRPRESYILATKLYFPMSPADQGLSRAQVLKQIDASLTRLRVDHVDLYQCHRHDGDTPIEETMQALTDIVREGKVRYLGFSEWNVPQIGSAVLPGMASFVSSQPQYSLLHRDPEQAVIPYCSALGISQIVWSPLAQGVLTGKYHPGASPPSGSRASHDQMGGMMHDWMRPAVLNAVQGLRPIAEQAGCSMAQFALAWVLREPNVAAAIIGASRTSQLDDNAAASGLQIDPVLFARAEAVLKER